MNKKTQKENGFKKYLTGNLKPDSQIILGRGASGIYGDLRKNPIMFKLVCENDEDLKVIFNIIMEQYGIKLAIDERVHDVVIAKREDFIEAK